MKLTFMLKHTDTGELFHKTLFLLFTEHTFARCRQKDKENALDLSLFFCKLLIVNFVARIQRIQGLFSSNDSFTNARFVCVYVHVWLKSRREP